MDYLLKTKKEFKKNKETGDTSYIYKNELDIAYGDFKGLGRTTACGKVLRDKAFNVAKNPKYDGYQRGLASMVYKFLIKSWKEVVLTIKLNKISVL